MNFKLAFRHILRNKLYSAISIIGLAVGISACLLISLNVFHELSFDQHHANKNRIYRVSSELDFNGKINAALSSLSLGPTLQNDYPEVESFCRFRALGTPTIKYNDKIFSEIKIEQTDSTVFNIFDFKLIKGNPNTALAKPTAIVISESVANRIFGNEDPINQVINMGSTSFSVTGVMENPKDNSEFEAEAYIPLRPSLFQGWQAFEQDWFRISFYTYLLFNKPVEKADFELKLIDFEKKYVQPWAAQASVTASIKYTITSLANLHFDNDKDYDAPKANPTFLIIFALLAGFILIIASINFINLTLAQSSKRAKEVGVRKTLGVSSGQLVRQFLTESLLITFLSMILALGLIEVLLQPFNVLTSKTFELAHVFSPMVILTMVLLLIVIGIGAGSYPALVMSRFEPNKVLKGSVPKTGGIGALRKLLILVQFGFSLFMIIGTLLINTQMEYMANLDIGFDKENIITLSMPNDKDVAESAPVLMNEFRQLSGVEKVTFGAIPSGQTGRLMFRVDQNGVLQEKTLKFIAVEDEFFSLMGIDLLEGRNFSKDIATDQQKAFIINETAAKQFGWANNALGKRMQWGLEANDSAANDGVVVGVVKDFNFNSLHSPLDPAVLIYQPNWLKGQLSIRLKNQNVGQTLNDIKAVWDKFSNGYPISYKFFDESLAANYLEEERMQKVFTYFSAISIILALLGLFALVSFSVENKTKEIGMRKILGASLGQLVWLVVKDFIGSILIAFFIVAPINYYLMQEWLNDFAYKTPITLSSFLVALLAGMVLSAVTVMYHIIKISKSNPVESLRYE
ncbi:MAG: ABC transporter permease [Bacteroidia bacterium]